MSRFHTVLLGAALPLLVAQAQTRQPLPATEEQGHGSTLEVEPGRPALKTSELERKPVAPWGRLPAYLWEDQKAIWSSPFRTSREHAHWWAIFGSTAAIAIATDKWTSKQLPNTADQIAVAHWTSRVGAVYTLMPVNAAIYFTGAFTENERLRETGFLGVEALANATIVVNILKLATQRQRPTEGDGEGRFWRGTGRVWNAGSSFPSGHAITTWAMASVFAHQYPRPLIVPVSIYGLAMTVNASRFAARKHFASDIIVGAAIGWFIGDYLFAKRHNPAVDPPPSKLSRVFSHIHLGGPLYPPPATPFGPMYSPLHGVRGLAR